MLQPSGASSTRPLPEDAGYDSANVGTWLWRQGSADVDIGAPAQPTAWWINFGSFVSGLGNGVTRLVGFTGFGTLGGGNLTAQVDGDAGQLARLVGSRYDINVNARPQGLALAVGGTGRVAPDGSISLTGGGDLDVRVSGAINPIGVSALNHANGVVTNLRGHTEIKAATIGAIDLIYGSTSTQHTPNETRAFDAFRSTRGIARGGFTLVPGDATFSLYSLSDQVTQDVADPGRLPLEFYSPYVSKSAINGYGWSWFTLWTNRTAIDMVSAGGNLTPLTSMVGTVTDEGIVYPSILRAVAPSGSLYYGQAVRFYQADSSVSPTPLLLAPSASGGELQFLAADSIFAGVFTVSPSSAPTSTMPTPQRPAYLAWLYPIGVIRVDGGRPQLCGGR